MNNDYNPAIQPRDDSALVLAHNKDYRPALISLTYTWGLGFIPSLVKFLKIRNTSLRVSETTIHYASGAFSTQYKNIDLYQVRSVNAAESVLTGGTIIVTMSDGTEHRLENIPNAGEISTKFRGLIDKQRRAQNVQSREQV